MAVKGILFFDVDGTLIPYGQKEIKPSLLALLEKAHAMGWMVCIATGRAYASLHATFPMLEDDVYFSVSSGSCLYYQGREAMPSLYLTREQLDGLLSLRKERGASFVFSTKDAVYSLGELYPYTRNLFTSQHTPPVPVSRLEEFPWQKVGLAAVQFVEDVLPLEEMRNRFRGELYWQQGGPHLSDAGRANKGIAVERMCGHFQVPRERTYAWGDFDNDLPMLKAVGHGWLMANTTHPVLLDQFPNHCHDIEAQVREIIGY